jgi:hypothetical protein
MTRAESSLLDRRQGAAPTRWRGAVFGLEVDSTFSLDGVRAKPGTATGRRTTMVLASARELERVWPADEAVSVLDRRHSDGSLMMAIDVHPELGYRIWAPRHGRHLVTPDGRRVMSALPDVAPWRWQRLLFAQVLPLAATLRGVELFHASAVELNGHALGFIASSGTGKTSIAVHLVGHGASLLTDDVLAVELTSEGVLAHPGGGLVNVTSSELRALPRGAQGRVGVVVGRSDKMHLTASLVSQPFPLRSIYFLRRGPGFGDLRIDQSAPPDPRLLLSSGFVPYVMSPERLTNHLEVCARVAECVRMFEIEIPAMCPAPEVAAVIRAHDEAGS